jgi:hypothetical protein
LEGGTKGDMRIFEAHFKGVSTQFGPRSIEKYFENPHVALCPQTKILEGKTKDEMRAFDVLVKGV